MIAAHLMAATERCNSGPVRDAFLGRSKAAGVETASGGWIDECRNLAANFAQLAAWMRQAFEQAPCIGMVRPLEEVVDRRGLHLLARVQHGDPVANLVCRLLLEKKNDKERHKIDDM